MKEQVSRRTVWGALLGLMLVPNSCRPKQPTYVVMGRPYGVNMMERLDAGILDDKVLFVVVQLYGGGPGVTDVVASGNLIQRATARIEGRAIDLLQNGGMYVFRGDALVSHQSTALSASQLKAVMRSGHPWGDALRSPQ